MVWCGPSPVVCVCVCVCVDVKELQKCRTLVPPAGSLTTVYYCLLSACFTKRVWRDVVSVCMLLKFSHTVAGKDPVPVNNCRLSLR